VIRREILKLGGLGAGLLAWPALAQDSSCPRALIYDGRFAEARALVHNTAHAHDCQADAAALWFRAFAGNAVGFARIDGVTSPADALILSDCARREGLRLEFPGTTTGQLVVWQISKRTSYDHFRLNRV
jgi:hypothetical protein